jgi:hypothetical protein
MHTKKSKSPLLGPTVLFAACVAVLLPSGVRADAEPAHGPNCPTDIPGTTLVAAPIADGAALIFFAPKHVGELRRRVRALSAVQNKGAVKPPDTAPAAVRELEPEATEAHEPLASVYDVHGGVMLKLSPSKVDQVSDVQARALDYAQRIVGGECPLPRDEQTVIRGSTPKPALAGHGQIPNGVVPGVGPIDTPSVLVPSLVL